MRSHAAWISLNMITRLQLRARFGLRQAMAASDHGQLGRDIALRCPDGAPRRDVPTRPVLLELWWRVALNRMALAGKTFPARIDRSVEAILQDIRR